MSAFEQFVRDNPKMANEPYGAALAEISARRSLARFDRDEAPPQFSPPSAEPFAEPRGLAMRPASAPPLLWSDDPRQMISPIMPRLLAACPQERSFSISGLIHLSLSSIR